MRVDWPKRLHLSSILTKELLYFANKVVKVVSMSKPLFPSGLIGVLSLCLAMPLSLH